MTQLDLFEWAHKESLLHDMGGRCAYCLEYDNWLTTDAYMNDEHQEELTIECQTVRMHEDGEFDSLCKNSRLLVDGVEQ